MADSLALAHARPLGAALALVQPVVAVALFCVGCWYALTCLQLYLLAPATYWSEVTRVAALDVVPSQLAAMLTVSVLRPAARLTPIGRAVGRGLGALPAPANALATTALLYAVALFLRPVYARLERRQGWRALALAALGVVVFGACLVPAYERATHISTHPAARAASPPPTEL